MSEIIQEPEFWTGLAFIIFVVLMFKPLKKALLAGLDSRIEQIRSEVEEAQRLREEAQTLLASYQRKQREAAQEAEEIVKQAKEDAAIHRSRGREGAGRAAEAPGSAGGRENRPGRGGRGTGSPRDRGRPGDRRHGEDPCREGPRRAVRPAGRQGDRRASPEASVTPVPALRGRKPFPAAASPTTSVIIPKRRARCSGHAAYSAASLYASGGGQLQTTWRSP